MKGHTGMVNSVAVARNDKPLLVSGGDDCHVRVWDRLVNIYIWDMLVNIYIWDRLVNIYIWDRLENILYMGYTLVNIFYLG